LDADSVQFKLEIDGVKRSRRDSIHVPLVSFSPVSSDLKPPVDGCDSAAAAMHSVRNFRESHVAIAKQHDNSIQFINGKVFTLRPDHFASCVVLQAGERTPTLADSDSFEGWCVFGKV
jgi:hypothetical protein